jgi:hypothetical protein
MGYERGFSDELQTHLSIWATLCRHGRESLFVANNGGFDANAGTEAARWQALTRRHTWPGGAWPAGGPAEALHQVGLMLSNSAGGRLGEIGALLDEGEVAWSLATHTRGVLELCGGLFRVYMRPFVPFASGGAPPEAALEMYASAHLLIIDGAFTAQTLARSYLALDPTDPDRRGAARHADAEVARITSAYSQHYDPGTTNVSKRNLKLGGVALDSMTCTLDDLAAWMWPDPTVRPQPLYRLYSGHAHSSLDADLQLYDIADLADRRELKRTVTKDFIAINVQAATLIFQRIFARLVGYYGWDEGPLHDYSEHLAEVFPEQFTYGT